MDTLAAIVSAGRDRDGAAVDAPGRTADYSSREFATNAWKAGNLLRHYGVRSGATLSLVVGPKDPDECDEAGWLGSAADPLLALLGGASLGAVVDLTPAEPIEGRAVVLPDAWLDRYDVAPGCSRLAYGGPPEETGVAHFERELWSENPIEPPDPVAPSDALLRVDGDEYTHETILEGAGTVAERYDLGADDRVAIDAPLTTAGTVAAGVAAPLSVGATIRLGASEPLPEDVRYVVSESTRWGERSFAPAKVL